PTKHGVSPTGPPSPQPPSPSFLSNDLRPITMAPTPSSISCRMARSSSVAAAKIQSCSMPAPSPNGFSLLSFGPVTYPSSEVDMSQITSAVNASSLCGQHGPIQTVPTYPDDAQRQLSSARHQINAPPSVLRPAH